MERDVLNNTQLIFGHLKMSLYEKQKTELDGLLIRRIFIIVSLELRFLHFSLHKEVEEQEYDRFVIRVFAVATVFI